jgi:hypothetical protein
LKNTTAVAIALKNVIPLNRRSFKSYVSTEPAMRSTKSSIFALECNALAIKPPRTRYQYSTGVTGLRTRARRVPAPIQGSTHAQGRSSKLSKCPVIKADFPGKDTPEPRGPGPVGFSPQDLGAVLADEPHKAGFGGRAIDALRRKNTRQVPL